jgi:prepilin peptidase CpaA
LLKLFDLAIFAVIGLAAFFDIEWRRIPNWLILFGLIVALGLSGLRGMNEFYQSLLGIGAGVGILFIPFAFRWIGAGDVKFLGVMGAFVGPYLMPRVLWYAVVASGAIAIVSLVFRHLNIRFAKELFENFKHTLFVLVTLGRLPSQPAFPWAGNRAHSVPWGVGIGLGTVAAYYLDPTGQWAGF